MDKIKLNQKWERLGILLIFRIYGMKLFSLLFISITIYFPCCRENGERFVSFMPFNISLKMQLVMYSSYMLMEKICILFKTSSKICDNRLETLHL